MAKQQSTKAAPVVATKSNALQAARTAANKQRKIEKAQREANEKALQRANVTHGQSRAERRAAEREAAVKAAKARAFTAKMKDAKEAKLAQKLFLERGVMHGTLNLIPVTVEIVAA